MPNCFSLTRKSDPAAGPVPLARVDDEMCFHFGVSPHPTKYHHHWYDLIGLALACGKTFAELRERYQQRAEEAEGAGDVEGAAFCRHLWEIAGWLDARFTPDSWVEVGR